MRGGDSRRRYPGLRRDARLLHGADRNDYGLAHEKGAKKNWRVEFCLRRDQGKARGAGRLRRFLKSILRALDLPPRHHPRGNHANHQPTQCSRPPRFGHALPGGLGLAASRSAFSQGARATWCPPSRIVTGILADADMEYLRTVATNIISEPGVRRAARVGNQRVHRHGKIRGRVG